MRAYGSRPDDYLTDVLARKATAFVKQSLDARTPFFLYLATYAPHQPATPAPRHANLFPDARAPRTASFDEADVSTKPAYIRNLPRFRPLQVARIDALYRRRLQSLQAVDEMIARLVETLGAAGALENTYVVFTSDNGFHLGQHRMLMGKQTAYEEDIRVPLIVRGPGVPKGRTVDRLAVETDLAPTFADLAGATPAAFVDGRSLVPLLGANLPPRWRQGLLIEHYTGDEPELTEFEKTQLAGRRRIPDYFALRTPEWTYVEYKTGERELYDVVRDPDALRNQIAKADPQIVQGLAARLAALRDCRTAACRDAEDRR